MVRFLSLRATGFLFAGMLLGCSGNPYANRGLTTSPTAAGSSSVANALGDTGAGNNLTTVASHLNCQPVPVAIGDYGDHACASVGETCVSVLDGGGTNRRFCQSPTDSKNYIAECCNDASVTGASGFSCQDNAVPVGQTGDAVCGANQKVALAVTAGNGTMELYGPSAALANGDVWVARCCQFQSASGVLSVPSNQYLPVPVNSSGAAVCGPSRIAIRTVSIGGACALYAGSAVSSDSVAACGNFLTQCVGISQ